MDDYDPDDAPKFAASILASIFAQKSSDLVSVNPAPHAAAPAAPTGKFGTVTIGGYGTPRIVVVSADDWEATYVDGKLFNEGETVMCSASYALFTHLGHYIHEVYSPKFQEYFGQDGGLHECPETLAELYKETGVEELVACI
jgi:hypothetical protein